MKWSSVLALILVVSWLDNPVHGSGQSLKPFKEFGVVTATNGTFKFVGQLLELYCNITNPTIMENSSRLHFEKGHKTVIESRFIEILTTKTIRLRLYNVSLVEEDSYVCVLTTFFNETLVVGHQDIEVDYKPEPVRDFKCRVYNWEEMNCTWDFGVPFRHLDYINTTLVWTMEFPGNSRSYGSQHVCPKMQLNFCFWDDKLYHHGHIYFMTLDVHTIVQEQLLWTSNSPNIKVETINYVEPAPVTQLAAGPVNSTCVELSWNHTAQFRKNKTFLAESRKLGEQNWASVFINQNQKMNAAVCRLSPYTSYEFRVAVLPNSLHSKNSSHEYRSQWQAVTAKTPEDIPSGAPEICPGCYYELSQPSDNNRSVRLYWKDLPDNVKNGQLTKYRFRYPNQNIMSESNLTVGKTGLMTSATLTLVSSDVNMLISLTPATIVGFAYSSASLLLPTLRTKPNAPSNFLVETDGKAWFFLSWKRLKIDERSGLEYSGVTIVWCVGHREGAVCLGDIQWVQLPADSVTHNISIGTNNSNVYSDYLVGITAEVQNHGQTWSSGIYWNSCTYLHNRQPQSDPKNLRESSEHPARGLIILWDKFHCSEERSFITEYLIKYCPSNENGKCAEPEQSSSVSNTARDVNLQDLKVGARYLVTVAAVSSAGLGPSGHILSAVVKAPPSGSNMISYILVVVILVPVLFICAIFIFWFIWKCRKSEKKVPKSSIPHTNEKKTKDPDIFNRPLPARPDDPKNDSSAFMKHSSKDAHSSGSRSEESDTSESLLLTNDHTKQTTRSNKASITCETRPLLDGVHRNNPQVDSTRMQSQNLPASETDSAPSYVLYDTESTSGAQLSSQKSELTEEPSARTHRFQSSECRLKSQAAPESRRLPSVRSQLVECVAEPGCGDISGGLDSTSSPQTSGCASYSRVQVADSNPACPVRAEGPSDQNYQLSLDSNSRPTTSSGSCADYSTLNVVEDQPGRDPTEAGGANFSNASTLQLRPRLEYVPVYQVSRQPGPVHFLKNETLTLKENKFDQPPKIVNVPASPLFFTRSKLINFPSNCGYDVKSSANNAEYVPHSQLHRLIPWLSKDDNNTDDPFRFNETQAEVCKFSGPESTTVDLTNILLSSSPPPHCASNTRAPPLGGADYISWDAVPQLASGSV